MSYRILSLDGGGTWALIQVKALQRIFGDDARGHDVLSNFDLVAANSGGSIVVAGMACDLKLSDILEMFDDPVKRKAIFVDLPSSGSHTLLGVGPRYSAAAKLKGFRTLFQWPDYHGENAAGSPADAPLDQLPGLVHKAGSRDTHFLIVAFDYDRSRGVFFRSNAASRAASSAVRYVPTLAQAVHASSNAPINYFDKPARWSGDAYAPRYWDGGVSGHNNPVLAAVTEALANGAARNEIRVLSIGTGTLSRPSEGPTCKPPVAEPRANEGLITGVKKMATAILADPPDAATFLAHVALDQPLSSDPQKPAVGNLVRLNPLIQPIRGPNGWRVPDGFTAKQFEALCALDMDAVDQPDVERIKQFCEAWLEGRVVNQAIRAVGADDFRVEIGHASFVAGMEHWRSVAM